MLLDYFKMLSMNSSGQAKGHDPNPQWRQSRLWKSQISRKYKYSFVHLWSISDFRLLKTGASFIRVAKFSIFTYICILPRTCAALHGNKRSYVTSVSQMKTLNIFYLVIHWTQKLHNGFIFLSSLHCVLFHSLLRGDFPSRWLQLLQWPLVSILGVPNQVEESLLQN